MLPAVPFMTYSAAMFLERYSRCPWLRYALALPSAIIVVALPAVLIVGWKIVPEINTTAIVLAATVLSVIGIAALLPPFQRQQPRTTAHDDKYPWQRHAHCRIHRCFGTASAKRLYRLQHYLPRGPHRCFTLQNHRYPRVAHEACREYGCLSP